MFDKNFYSGNRVRLMDVLDDTLVIVPAHSLLQASADLAYPFKQDKSFWYLCGVDEPDAVLIMDTKKQVSTILLPKRNDYHAEWDGAYDQSRIREHSGIDSVEIVEMKTKIAEIISEALENGMKIGHMKPLEQKVEPYGFFSNPARKIIQSEIQAAIKQTGRLVEDVLVDVRLPIARLRQSKQPIEIAAIQKAIDITASGLQAVYSMLQSYTSEKQIERALSAHFYGQADGHAFEPIIACGKNAATIHYTKNDQPLVRDKLILLDVGAEKSGYAADISRTWSLQGKPSQRQKDIHALVLDVQQYAMSLLKPGVLLHDNQKLVEDYYFKQAKQLNITAKSYPHGISHFMGLDVHDAGDYLEPLTEGTVVTVEPGVYLPEEAIGVRIEDDVLVTSYGVKNLSASIPNNL